MSDPAFAATITARPVPARDHCLAPGRIDAPIVGEVLVGIVDADVESYRSVDRSWRPTLPSRAAGRFDLVDALLPPGD